jgi:hypothetical protein
MCVVYWAASAAPGDCAALARHPDVALLLAVNRDEFFDRRVCGRERKRERESNCCSGVCAAAARR